MPITQRNHAETLIAAMRTLDERARTTAEALDAEAFAWTPAPQVWSVGQVFEHLCVANDSYVAALRGLISLTPASRSAECTDWIWRPSLAGRLLARAMESPRKLPAPKIWRPAPAPRDDVIDAFLDRQREIVALIERSLDREWRRLRLASPVSRLIRMNVGDAFTVLVRHAERHFRQIDARRAQHAALGAVLQSR